MERGEVKKSDTATQILDVAERLAQVRGFNAFSYADVAAELKITNAALHYHFAGKSDLGAALIARYASRFAEALRAVESRVTDAAGRLDAYAEALHGSAPRRADVPLRHVGSGVPHASRSDAGRGRSLLQRERGVAHSCPRARQGPRNAAIRWVAARSRPHDREHARGRDARRSALWRRPAVPGGGEALAGDFETTICRTRSISERTQYDAEVTRSEHLVRFNRSGFMPRRR